MESTGPLIVGLHLDVFLMLTAGVFYAICALFLWKPMREEKNELIGALFAFLSYQAISMIFMGLEMQTMNMNFSYIATLSVFIGSTYMLKLPFSSFSQKTRRMVFMLSLIVVLGLFVWFMQTPERQMALMNFTLWYDIVINGLVVGGFMFVLALRTSEHYLRIKALGGGSGVVSCCVVSNAALLSGAILTSTVFAFLAPVLILGSLIFARRRERKI